MSETGDPGAPPHKSRFDPCQATDSLGILPSKIEKRFCLAVKECKWDGETSGFARISAIIDEDPSIISADCGNGFNCLHIILGGSGFSIDEVGKGGGGGGNGDEGSGGGQEEEERGEANGEEADSGVGASGLKEEGGGRKRASGEVDVKKKEEPSKKARKENGLVRLGEGAATTIELVTHLLQLGADLRAINSSGHTPLGWAVSSGFNNEAIVDLLVREGSDPDARARNGSEVSPNFCVLELKFNLLFL